MKDLFIFCVSFTYQVLHPHLVRAPSLTPKTLRATIIYYFHLHNANSKKAEFPSVGFNNKQPSKSHTSNPSEPVLPGYNKLQKG